MKISAVTFILCRSELARPIPLSCGVLTHRNFGLVRVDTDDGLTGWGETSVNFPPWTYRERAATIEEGLAPLLLGQTLTDVLTLRDRMVGAMRPFTRMWAEGAVAQAISGVEIALWDLLGKAKNMSVAELLGGAKRREFLCYATGLRTDDPAGGALEAVAAGYRAIKMRVGFDDTADVRSAIAIREAVGPDIALLIDANQAFDLPRASGMLAALSSVDPYWIEEPVLSDDFDTQAELRKRFPGLRLAWGENAVRRDHFERVSRENLADVIMPDPCRCGGLAQALDAAGISEAAGRRISAHHYGSDLGFAAMLHFMSVCGNVDLVLRDIAKVPLRDAIVVEDIAPRNGQVVLPEGPGLGVTPDPEIIERTRLRL